MCQSGIRMVRSRGADSICRLSTKMSRLFAEQDRARSCHKRPPRDIGGKITERQVSLASFFRQFMCFWTESQREKRDIMSEAREQGDEDGKETKMETRENRGRKNETRERQRERERDREKREEGKRERGSSGGWVSGTTCGLVFVVAKRARNGFSGKQRSPRTPKSLLQSRQLHRRPQWTCAKCSTFYWTETRVTFRRRGKGQHSPSGHTAVRGNSRCGHDHSRQILWRMNRKTMQQPWVRHRTSCRRLGYSIVRRLSRRRCSGGAAADRQEAEHGRKLHQESDQQTRAVTNCFAGVGPDPPSSLEGTLQGFGRVTLEV